MYCLAAQGNLRRLTLCSALRRLLSSFQNSLEEITIIARPTDDLGADAVTKAVQLKSYNDPSRGGHRYVM